MTAETFGIELEERDGATIGRLSGRFDGDGAARFDREALATLGARPAVVLDLARVPYVSSAALRSFLKLAKGLAASGGTLVLAGPTPYVSQVLELSGLLDRFRVAPGLREALALLEATRPASGPTELAAGERRWEVTPLGRPGSRLVRWGGGAVGPGPGAFESPSVAQLGIALGLGGLGTNRAEAVRAAGPFLSTGRLVALAPAGERGEPDFLLTDRPDHSTVHVASGVTFAGEPAGHLRLERGTPTLGVAADDALALARQAGAETAGLVLLAERADGPSLLVVAVAGADAEAFAQESGCVSTPSGEPLLAVAVSRGSAPAWPAAGTDLRAALGKLLALEELETVSVLAPQTPLRRVEGWFFAPAASLRGRDLLTEVHLAEGGEIPDEWLTITRRVCPAASRVTLSRLSGGYNATTYAVEAFDREGRRTIPTVLKIANLAYASREERAWRQMVAPFILNNATVMMGKATEGPWAGLRFNLVGISGPSSRLRWVGDRYAERPAEELVPILDTLFGRILDPWYGQAREEAIPLWAEHDPSDLFPRLLDDARAVLGLGPEDEEVDVPELGRRLPNPFRYLAEQLVRRHGRTWRWKVSITHGDLNTNNVLLDEKDNIFVIDFSETRHRNVVSDFARLEALFVLQTTRCEEPADLVRVARFVEGLVSVGRLDEAPPIVDDGGDPAVRKAWVLVAALRRHAARVAAPGTDLVPYLLPLLEWTLPIVSFQQISPLGKRLAMVASALVVARILEIDPGA